MTNTPNLLTTLTPSASLVRDDGACYTASGMRVPEADVRSREIAEQAARWLALAEDRTRMRRHTLVAKALSSVAFSVQHGAASLAVPSKLAGTSEHQRTLWAMVREHVAPWTELALDDAGDGLAVRYGGDVLGEVQPKHLPWVRPLVPFGLTAHLARVTGTPYEGFTLGLNCVLGNVGLALGRLWDALGATPPPPGARPDAGPQVGDGAPPRTMPEISEQSAADAPAVGGDGAVGGLRLVISGGVPVRPEHDAARPDADLDDVVLYRRCLGGTACCSIRHVPRHSPTGCLDKGEG